MQEPEWFAEQLRLVDPSLSVRWHTGRSRWLILRRNPRRPSHPAEIVCTVQEPDGSFRPLDRRTIDKLYRMDTQRRFGGAAWFHGRRIEAELDEEQAALDRKKQAIKDDRCNEIHDRAKFFFRNEERHGRAVS